MWHCLEMLQGCDGSRGWKQDSFWLIWDQDQFSALNKISRCADDRLIYASVWLDFFFFPSLSTVPMWMLSLEAYFFFPFFCIGADISVVWYVLSLSINLTVLFTLPVSIALFVTVL